ncbi:MAG: hypothetical protein ACTSRZ_19190, partial [Promethearchaeota archaeon]
EGNIQIYQQNDLNKTNALKKFNVAIVKDQNSSSSDKINLNYDSNFYYIPSFIIYQVFHSIFSDPFGKKHKEDNLLKINRFLNFLRNKNIIILKPIYNWLYNQEIFRKFLAKNPKTHFILVSPFKNNKNIHDFLIKRYYPTDLVKEVAYEFGIATANNAPNILINDVDMLLFSRDLKEIFNFYKDMGIIKLTQLTHEPNLYLMKSITEPILYKNARNFRLTTLKDFYKNIIKGGI